MYVSTNLSTHLSSVQLLIHFIRLSLNSFIHPAMYLSIHQPSMHVFIYAYICLFIPSYIHHLSSIRLQSIHLCYLCIHLYDHLCIIHPPCHACIHWLIYTLPMNPFMHPSVYPCILPSTNLSIHLPKHHHPSIFPVIFSNQPTMQ